jgi:hypothetical protein
VKAKCAWHTVPGRRLPHLEPLAAYRHETDLPGDKPKVRPAILNALERLNAAREARSAREIADEPADFLP